MRLSKFRTLRYFRDQLRRIIVLGVMALISAEFQAIALILVVPLAKTIADGKHVFKGSLGPISFEATTTTLALCAMGAIVIAAILDATNAWWRSVIMAKWEYARREEVVSEFLHTEYEIQAGERLGTLATLAGFVARGTIAFGAVINGFSALITILLFVAFALLLDVRAAFFLIGTVLFLSLNIRPVMIRTKRYSKATSAMMVDYGREVTEATRMVRDTRVFDAIGATSARLTRISERLARLRQRSAFAQNITSPVYQYAGMLLIVGGLAAAAGLDTQDITRLGAIALLLLRSMTYGQQLQNSYQTILDTMQYVDRMEEMRTVYQAHPTNDGHLVLEPIHRLELERVSYTYDGEVDTLAAVSATFQVGEIVGIVGPSGSGKSTLSQLLLRLREPTAGEIKANDTSAAEYTLASWYRHVSLVPQDPRLFHGTVIDNIAFLDPTITREHVIEAAKAAGVHDVIESLEKGYDTPIGPAFRDLSGGQIQRIGIARALARGAEVLVLDEPTSALDVHSEAVIQATLERLRGRALVLIIAHRLSTLSICDRIMVLHNGALETIGPLAEVAERSDFFRRALDAGTLEVGLSERPLLPSPEDH